MSNKNNGSDDGLSLYILLAMLAVAAMPFVGIYFLAGENRTDGQRVLGAVLLVVGIVLWIRVGMN